MALINCPDCDKEVSSNAPACPSCGSPIAGVKESSGSGVNHLTTVQETSKKFKVHSLISITLFLLGIIVMVIGGGAKDETTAGVGSWMLFIGLIWYLVNRFRIWWHHK